MFEKVVAFSSRHCDAWFLTQAPGDEMGLDNLFKLFQSLDERKKNEFVRKAQEMLMAPKGFATYLTAAREGRFKDGLVCPHCKGAKVKRNGMYRQIPGKGGRSPKGPLVPRQRYLCADCRRTFNDLTSSPIEGSWYADKWAHYIRLMFDGLAIRKCATNLGISTTTAFYWRHKVLRALAGQDSPQRLKGVVEADETFFLESFKGKRDLTARPPRKRGGKAKRRGLSQEQIAVLAAVDRAGGIVCRMAGRGKIAAEKIDAVLGERLARETTLVTDHAGTFTRFAALRGLQLRQINLKRKIYKSGIFHIQHVNSYHSRLKKWMLRFHGVATKYLDHYLAWFRALELTKAMQDQERLATVFCDTVRPMLSTRRSMFPFAEVP